MIRDKNDHRPRPITVLEIVEISNDRLVLKNKNDVLIKLKAE